MGKGFKRQTGVCQEQRERAEILGEFIADNNSTVRAAAARFGISKSTVHKDITEKLPEINPSLSVRVKKVLETNKQERHIRGGMATKHKYEERSRLRSLKYHR